MVVGLNDIVDITGPLFGGIHYLATHVATRRAFRHSKPVFPVYDPILLIQFNYLGLPIIHKSLAYLFPETSVEPWHRLMVRAWLAGSNLSLTEGSHTVIDSWPRPELSGAYSQYNFSIDSDAVMEAVPTVLVQEVNQQPVYSLRNPRSESITAFCRNCSLDFIASLAKSNVSVQTAQAFDYSRIKATTTSYVAWFDGIQEGLNDETLSQLQLALEFPGLVVASPRLVDEFTIPTYHHPAFSTLGGITPGFAPTAWMARPSQLDVNPPTTGYTNNQAMLKKIT